MTDGRFSAPSGRIPSLDGFRGVGMCAVLLTHLTGTAGFPARLQFLDAIGSLGVRTFFILSGFLITTLLLKESSDRGGVDLKAFYIRRMLRLLPAFAIYVTFVAIAGALGWCKLFPGDLSHALTYTMNYQAPQAWSLGHLWSLSVEEQFYVLWPATFLLLGVARSVPLLCSVILLCPLVRVLLLLNTRQEHWLVVQHFEANADALAIGCLLACQAEKLIRNEWYRSVIRSKYFVVVPLAAIAVNQYTAHHQGIDGAFGQSVKNVLMALTVHHATIVPSASIGRLLNTTAFTQIGVMSYSIYLWQQFFINRHEVSAYTTFPVSVLLAVAAGYCSYRLVERPIAKLRYRSRDSRRPDTQPAAHPADLTPYRRPDPA